MAKRTAYGLNEIRKLINVEEKFIDNNFTLSPDSVTGAVSYLTPVPQGDDIAQREGNSIKIQRFLAKGIVRWNSSATGPQAVRVLVVRDLQNPGATITVSDVLETIGTVSAPFQQLDFINKQNGRFTVVDDQLFTVDQYNPIVPFEMNSAHDCHVFFRGGTNTVASAGNGAYFMLAVSDYAATVPVVISSTRLYFTDN